MTINITNRTKQHKIPQKNNTETKHTDLSYHTGSCTVHLNCLPPRVAGVNYWFFLLAHLVVGVGIKENVECSCEIEGETNVQNGGFSAKLQNGDGSDMLHN